VSESTSEDERAHCGKVATEMAQNRLMRVSSDVEILLRERAAAFAAGEARGRSEATSAYVNQPVTLRETQTERDALQARVRELEQQLKPDREQAERARADRLEALADTLAAKLAEANACTIENGDLLVSHYEDAEQLRAERDALQAEHEALREAAEAFRQTSHKHERRDLFALLRTKEEGK